MPREKRPPCEGSGQLPRQLPDYDWQNLNLADCPFCGAKVTLLKRSGVLTRHLRGRERRTELPTARH
jgi:hypothetical protein